LRESIAAVVPGYEAIGKLGDGGKEFQITGRTFHRPTFATPDEKAHFHTTPLPHWRPAPGRFRLMTLRSEGQFNSVVYEEEDLYRNSAPRNAALMAAADLRRLALRHGQRIRVESQAGEMIAVAWEADLPAGNIAMYYPEANVLVPRNLDPRSHTPAFKSVEVWLRS
jgi:anaerobic selenocysteine-containing dehydrogenase